MIPGCQGRPLYAFVIWEVTIIFNNSSRFPKPVSLLDKKKKDVAVGTMKDYFLQQIRENSKSNYFLKVTERNLFNNYHNKTF